MNECRRLRGTVGDWESFKVRSAAACPASDEFMCVSGWATFANAGYRVLIAYRLEAGRARLDSLVLWNGETWAFPPLLPGGRKRYYDPPQRAPGGPSSS